LLGVLAGAGFGAAVAILLDWPPLPRMVAAFAGGLCAVSAGIAIAALFGDNEDGNIFAAGIRRPRQHRCSRHCSRS
jgi:iron complex transport system permease protein